MKQRFSSLDVKVITHELSSALCTLRLSNVYDLSSRIFLLKFAKPDCRRSLLIDVGFRCHLTDFVRATASNPSSFVSRLRKFLRTRRVTSVAQVGTDRIVELQFSDGQFRLFLEFFAGGNIVLTNKDLHILALFRNVSGGPNQEELRVGLKYSLDNRQNLNGPPLLKIERVRKGLQEVLDKTSGDTAVPLQKSKRTSRDGLRKALAGVFSEFPPTLLDHALRVTNFDGTTSVKDVVKNEEILYELFHALEEAQKINENITGSYICKGYIIAKEQRNARVQDGNERSPENLEYQRQNLVYQDFQPFRPRQYEEDDAIVKILEFDGFNRTVDEFFSSVESQKLESRIVEREEHARKKLENAKQDHEKRLDGLQKVQELNVRKAQAIEANLQRVQEAINAVNSLVAQGIGWPEIAQLIEMEQQRNNSVAEMIQLPLKLHENTITLSLTEADFEDESDFEGNETDSDVSDSQDEAKASKSKSATNVENKSLVVEVDLGHSPWSNARQYYDQKRTAAGKEQRTIQSSEKALKSTERKINADLKKGLTQEKEVLRPQRNPFWFEKFIYFISSEGYLILGGKDAQQSEIIYRKYLTKGDAYVHADLQGAASTIIKNKPGQSEKPIPPSTLSQAGTLTVCTSSAWDSKSIMSAWWVNADQVGKTSPSGEFLLAGAFAITGEKNFLPPAQLLLGIGLMFKISEDSKARHFKHRRTVDPEPSSTELSRTSHDAELQDFGSQDPGDYLEEDEERNDQRTSDIEEIEHDESALASLSGNHDDEDSSQYEYENNHSLYNPLQPYGAHHELPAQASPDATGAYSSDSQSIDSGDQVMNETMEGKDAISNGNRPDEMKPATSDAQYSVRHVSAYERRMLRKGHQLSVSEKSLELSTPASSTPSSVAQREGNIKEAIPHPHVRGKRGKRYKIKTKYADQDDEERALAMRLLGSASAERKAQENLEANATKEGKQAAEKERRRKQQALIIEKGKEAEEKRRRMFQEGIGAEEDGEPVIEEDLEAFVGTALSGDEILDALIVCGPWDAIGSRCRWKAKLQPGSVKKGKAVKEVLGAWNATLKAWEKQKQPHRQDGNESIADDDNVRRREAELIRALREPEIVGVVPVGKVRVMMGAVGGSSKPRGGGTAGRGRRGGKGGKRK